MRQARGLRTVHVRRPVAAVVAGALAASALVAALLVAGATQAPAAGLALCGNPSPPTHPTKHVLVVMLENKSYSQVVGNTKQAPYQTSLANQCGLGTRVFGATHTSAANYLALSAGEFPANSPRGCGGVSACADPSQSLYSQLDSAGLGWKAYEEGMPTACAPSSGGNYKIGHNPPLFYRLTDCAANDLPVGDLTAAQGPLWTDLQNQTLPAFGYVTPSLANDGEGTGACGLPTPG